jgi:hypothetical protein
MIKQKSRKILPIPSNFQRCFKICKISWIFCRSGGIPTSVAAVIVFGIQIFQLTAVSSNLDHSNKSVWFRKSVAGPQASLFVERLWLCFQSRSFNWPQYRPMWTTPTNLCDFVNPSQARTAGYSWNGSDCASNRDLSIDRSIVLFGPLHNVCSFSSIGRRNAGVVIRGASLTVLPIQIFQLNAVSSNVDNSNKSVWFRKSVAGPQASLFVERLWLCFELSSFNWTQYRPIWTTPTNLCDFRTLSQASRRRYSWSVSDCASNRDLSIDRSINQCGPLPKNCNISSIFPNICWPLHFHPHESSVHINPTKFATSHVFSQSKVNWCSKVESTFCLRNYNSLKLQCSRRSRGLKKNWLLFLNFFESNHINFLRFHKIVIKNSMIGSQKINIFWRNKKGKSTEIFLRFFELKTEGFWSHRDRMSNSRHNSRVPFSVNSIYF